MRIALVGPARPSDLAARLGGGAPALAALSGSSVIGHLATTLHDRGHEVLVVTLSRDVGAEPVRLAGPRMELRVGHYRPVHRARDAFAGERRAVQALLREGSPPDVVHAHWTYEFALAALADGAPVVVTVHDWAPRVLRFHPHPYRLVRLGLAARVLRASRHTTAVSPYLADRVERWTRRRPVVVPNGLPAEEFSATSTGAAHGAFVAINDGFSRWKNVASLLHAFALLRRRRG
ncbi:MAG: glycosyltransferase, partial [Actinobacteria bacterium]|nr:glycosyltransferase [Actinomycetota bacterium]